MFFFLSFFSKNLLSFNSFFFSAIRTANQPRPSQADGCVVVDGKHKQWCQPEPRAIQPTTACHLHPADRNLLLHPHDIDGSGSRSGAARGCRTQLVSTKQNQKKNFFLIILPGHFFPLPFLPANYYLPNPIHYQDGVTQRAYSFFSALFCCHARQEKSVLMGVKVVIFR